MSDDRFTPEQAEIDQAAKANKPTRVSSDPPLLPCRRYVEQPAVTPEEIERFAEELKRGAPVLP